MWMHSSIPSFRKYKLDSYFKKRSTTYSRNSVIQKRLTLCANFYTTFWSTSCVVIFSLSNPYEVFVGLYLSQNNFYKRSENHDYYVQSVIETRHAPSPNFSGSVIPDTEMQGSVIDLLCPIAGVHRIYKESNPGFPGMTERRESRVRSFLDPMHACYRPK
jgi:uncharacterized protein (DUF1919 family)